MNLKTTSTLDAQQVRRMVSVRQVLAAVGAKITSDKRAACPLCRGSARLTLAYTDSVWYCHRCGKGGDVFRLVEEVEGSGFREALTFVAGLAGISAGESQSESSRRNMRERIAERARAQRAAETLAAAERPLRIQYRNEIHKLDEVERLTSRRLENALQRSPAPEQLWRQLQASVELRWAVVAGYSVLAFGSIEERARFVTRPWERHAIIKQVLQSGSIRMDNGKPMEICL